MTGSVTASKQGQPGESVEQLCKIQEVVRNLVWLPTWHQACLLCIGMGTSDDRFQKNQQFARIRTPTEELLENEAKLSL